MKTSCSLLLSLCVLAVSGCATLNEKECRTVNWRELGVQDGSAGYPARRIGEHQDACAEFGIRPDATAYARGRDEGLRRYCEPRNAVREGLAGRSYEQGVCPPAIEANFLPLHRAAYEVHQARERVASLDRQTDSTEHELRSDKITDEKRARLRDELRDLDRKTRRARDDLRWREGDLDRLTRGMGWLY